MDYRRLGRTDIKVSSICLGTMMWGEQNTIEEAHAQLDYALEHGVNFVDTAELYPVPPMAETFTRTETYIGEWFKKTGNRDKVVLASKVAGPGFEHIRGGSGYSRKSIKQALEGSLKRLQTDYIDLYQLHWSERPIPKFNERIYNHDAQYEAMPFEDILDALQEFVKEGKIRHIGVSNESPWGLMQYLKLADEKGLPRMVSIQNKYSLLDRQFEGGLSEIAVEEDCGLLAWSPLYGGILTGKYLDDQRPEGARLTLFPRWLFRLGPVTDEIVKAYKKVADDAGLSLAQMALQFVTTRPFVTSNIIGATNLVQLKENIESTKVKLSDAVLQQINDLHNRYPNLIL